MTLIRDGKLAQDRYVRVADDAPLPPGPVMLSLARLGKEAESTPPSSVLSRNQDIAVIVPNTADVSKAWPLIGGCAAIVLEFPAFADGRAYSQALLLRSRHRYAGEIRAQGAAVVRDQMQGMLRCGINSFDLRADQDAKAWAGANGDFSLAYQESAAPAEVVIGLRQSPGS